jgi:hypothetical protein
MAVDDRRFVADDFFFLSSFLSLLEKNARVSSFL